MTEAPFHATRIGRVFFEHTMPELTRQLAKLNEYLERARAEPFDEDAGTRPEPDWGRDPDG